MESQTDNRNRIIIGILVVAVIFVGVAYIIWKSGSSTPAGSVATSTATSTVATASSTAVSVSVGGSTASSSGYTIKMVSSGTAPVAPSFRTPLTFSDPTLTDADRVSMQSQFAAAQAILVKTPTDFNAWIELGDLRKEAGDYAGAAADWQYMSALYPANIVSNANLGDLYTNYLHDYPKAAAALKAQIVNYPTDVYIYENLFQLYTNQYPQSTATIVALLKQGIAANPGAAELKADLAKYQ